MDYSVPQPDPLVEKFLRPQVFEFTLSLVVFFLLFTEQLPTELVRFARICVNC
jgi:hypothetical protein